MSMQRVPCKQLKRLGRLLGLRISVSEGALGTRGPLMVEASRREPILPEVFGKVALDFEIRSHVFEKTKVALLCKVAGNLLLVALADGKDSWMILLDRAKMGHQYGRIHRLDATTWEHLHTIDEMMFEVSDGVAACFFYEEDHWVVCDLM